MPVALAMALATAAMGGTMGVSPTPRTPVGMARVRHLHDHRVDHRQVGGDGHAIVEEARVLQLAVGAVDVLLVERPADALRRAALELALDVGRMDRACRHPGSRCSA